MKPDWKSAPKWAKYLAQDSDGLWNWYSKKPKLLGVCWSFDGIRFDSASVPHEKDWKETLEPRP